ncbi:WG repeat-containing protein [Spirosoma aureum]|uniref:WG repeat-containing protein n=1 Tax=Spirosoma aureum TaxID=2692134 RepID=A0A6G9AMV5_9BACT|nr:WG repeat-containing protein [Spirosoma aureum]QIP13787.1 WG repeat-containing protein [Spirosoma aureum]
METTTTPQKPKKWYNKVWLAVLSGLLLFPVNSYVLWKNTTIRKLWKVLIFIVSPFFTLLTIGLLTLTYLFVSPLVKEISQTLSDKISARPEDDRPKVFYDLTTALAGYKDSDGEIIIPAKYDYASDIVDSSAVVCQDGKYGYIDDAGNQLLPLQFEEAFTFIDGVAVVKKGGQWMTIDSKGQTLKTLNYDDIFQMDSLYCSEKDALYGYLNDKGEEIMKPKLTIPYFFRNGLANFGHYENGNVYMNTRLKLGLFVECTKGDDFSDGLAAVIRNGKVGFINTKGELVIPAEYDYQERNGMTFLPSFYLGRASVEKNGKHGFINKKGETIIPFNYDDTGSFFETGITSVEINKKHGAIDTLGNFVIQPIYESLNDFYSEEAVRAKLNGKYGFVDKTGKVIVPFIYDLAYDYNQGAPFVQRNGKWALLNKEGKPITPFQFEGVYGRFSEGLACVKLNGKYGYISKSGKVIIDYKFENGENFSNGVVSRYNNGRKYIYDKKGREIRVE